MTVVTDGVKIQAALSQGLEYYWRLELDNGKVVDQFDSDGNDVCLGDHCKLLQKSPVDPYAENIVVTGVKRVGWIPAHDGWKAFMVSMEKGDEGLVLYRKNYLAAGTSGGAYRVYVIGRRYPSASLSEEMVWHICPPKGDAASFPGGVTQSTDPLHRNMFDKWLDEGKGFGG